MGALKWEYSTLTFREWTASSFDTIHDFMSAYGREGWELVCLDRDDAGERIWYFKRAVAEAAKVAAPHEATAEARDE